MLKRTTSLLAGMLLAAAAHAAEPKIAVTDLTYEEKVSQYFRVVAASNKSSVNASESYRERDSDYSSSASGRSKLNAKSESQYFEAEGTYTYIDRGELRKFTADIKGEMLKSGVYRVTQAKPYTAKDKEKIYDVIDRIKKGMYPNADYVLFGSVSNLEWRNEGGMVQGAGKATHVLSLELVADFSLINTRTYEVKAAFSAMGEGQDVKILSGTNVAVPNRSKVIMEVSKSLGEDVARQLQEQFDPSVKHSSSRRSSPSSSTEVIEQKNEEVMILK